MTLVDEPGGAAGAVRPWLDPARVPAFHLDLRTGTLAWTDAHSRLYGYSPAEVAPSMDMVYEHKHPRDRPRLRRLIRAAVDDARGFVFVHRILTRTGATVPVVAAVDAIAGADGTVAGLTGVTLALDERAVADAALATPDDPDTVVAALMQEIGQLREGLVHRDEIGMAKGIVMALNKVTGDEAFARLVSASQRTNVKLREVARFVVETGTLPG